MVKLDVADAALGQPPSQQAVARKGAVHALDTVGVEHRPRLLGEVGGRGQARLHLESHLVLAEPRGHFGVVDSVGLALGELGHRIDHIPLLIAGDALGIAQVEDGVALGAELHALEAAGQKPTVPLPRRDGLHLAAAALRHQHDVAGQVGGVGPDPVPEP